MTASTGGQHAHIPALDQGLDRFVHSSVPPFYSLCNEDVSPVEGVKDAFYSTWALPRKQVRNMDGTVAVLTHKRLQSAGGGGIKSIDFMAQSVLIKH